MHSLFEAFLDTSTMIDAEIQLIDLGSDSLPILESLFNGEAKNSFGVPYRELGLPLRCALEVAARLGPAARPLERYLRAELGSGHSATAAAALGSLGVLEEASIVDLAARLDGDAIVSMECAAALILCGETSHPAVLQAVACSERAAKSMERTRRYLASA